MERVLTGSDPATTNNRMELQAVLQGLRALKRPCQVTLITDSQLVTKGLTEWIARWQQNGWRTSKRQPDEHRDLWEALVAARAPHTLTVEWVPGRAGHPLNERVNLLARAAR